MAENNKIYITANELAEMLGVSVGHAYKLIDQWEQELDRIEKTVLKYRKPFFFAEARCMSRKGSGMIPNNWELQGELRLEEQCEWYRAMFEACKK